MEVCQECRGQVVGLALHISTLLGSFPSMIHEAYTNCNLLIQSSVISHHNAGKFLKNNENRNDISSEI